MTSQGQKQTALHYQSALPVQGVVVRFGVEEKETTGSILVSQLSRALVQAECCLN